ncbi:MAG: S1 family peptidase [Pseudobdellovibrio sp.]
MKQLKFVFLSVLFLMACSKNDTPNPTDKTGQLSADIMGGVDVDAQFQNANGVVGLLLVGQKADGSSSNAICTGSLIASNVVLSAGHCVSSSADFKLQEIFVIFATDIKSVVPEIKSNKLVHVRAADAVIRHEAFGADPNTKMLLNDLSLIRFSGTAPAGFQLAQIAEDTAFSALKVGSALSLSGYGVTSYSLDPTTQNPVATGAGVLRNIDNRKITQITSDRSKILMSQQDNKGACHGDSGGPAFVVDPLSSQRYLVGVTSQGYWLDSQNMVGNPLCNQLNVYTDLENYKDWISQNLQAIQNK